MRGIVTGRAAAFALLLLSSGWPASGSGWQRLTSSSFELYTDTGEDTGRRALERFEQIHAAFRGMGISGVEPALPLRIYLFGSAAEFGQYQPTSATKGFYHSAAEEDFIVMSGSAAEVWRVAYHEYVHAVLNHTPVPLPKWLEEGTAEFYSTLTVDGDEIVLGRPIESHVQTLRTETWLSGEELAAVDRESPIYSEDRRVGIFYAQSWALAHMLQMSPRYSPRNERYAELLAEAMPDGEAFRQAYGREMEEAVRELRGYVSRNHWPTRRRPWRAPEEVAIQVEPLEDDEAALVRLRLQLALGLWDVSERELARLARTEGSSPVVETARALIAMSRDDFAAARGHFETAIEMGSEDASTYFEYAMLLKETREAADKVQELIEKTVALNPRFAEAQFLLGAAATREGRYPDAIAHLREAVKILPRQSYFWHALATAYHQSGKTVEARRAARHALSTARPGHETEMARAALRMVEEPLSGAPRPEQPEVITPESWQNRAGDSRVAGELREIECTEGKAILHVRSGGETWRLRVEDPSAVVLRGLGAISFEFACGAARSVPVVVEYIADGSAGAKTAGEVTAIEFPEQSRERTKE